MKQIELGNTGEKVSAFCLGTRSFVSPQDEKQPFALLDQFVEAGGNFVDTANLGENNVGQWMQKRRNRGRLFVAAQAGLPGPGTPRGTRA
jgi:aryl-alcohol dehydrogenase-like predicted oxidoreductase